jgi:hypothetical protein
MDFASNAALFHVAASASVISPALAIKPTKAVICRSLRRCTFMSFPLRIEICKNYFDLG